MDQQEQIDRLREQVGTWNREDFHDLRKAVDATAMTVAVMQERQAANGELMKRIELASVETRDLVKAQNGRVHDQHTRLAVLETRELDGRTDGAKWGGYVGAFVAALVSGFAAYFGKGGQ